MIYKLDEKDVVVAPNCSLCRSDDRLVISQVHLEDKAFCFFETSCCRQCGFVYRSRKPSLEWFERQWQERTDKTTASEAAKLAAEKAVTNVNREKRYRSLERHLAFVVSEGEKSLLDVGCGPGYGLRMFADLDWQVTGLEPDPERAAIGGKEWGLNIQSTTLEDFKTEERFSVVSFIHVLEHLQDPVDCLKRASKLIRDDGFIYVEVPMFSWFVDWRDSLYLEHVNNFNFITLALAGHLAGLNVEQLYYTRTHPSGAVHMAILFKKELQIPGLLPPKEYPITRQNYDFIREEEEWWTINSAIVGPEPITIKRDLTGSRVSGPYLQEIKNAYRHMFKACPLRGAAPIPQPLFGPTTINYEVKDITSVSHIVAESKLPTFEFARCLVTVPSGILGDRKLQVKKVSDTTTKKETT